MRRLAQIMHHPLTILAGLALGIAAGLWLPGTIPVMKALGDGYLLLFKMCVAPILITLITASIARITGLAESGRLVRRIVIAFPASMILIAVLGTLCAVIAGPGRHLSPEARASLGGTLASSGSTLQMPLFATSAGDAQPPPFVGFLNTILPANIFESLASDAALQIIFTAVIFGAALGLVSEGRRTVVINFFEGISEAFQAIVNRLMLLLPLGLLVITAPNVRAFSSSTIIAMGLFVAVGLALMIGISIVSIAVVAATSRRGLVEAYRAMRQTLILALVTQNSFASLPSSIKALQELGFSDDVANLAGPLAVTTCRLGSVGYIAVSAVFVAQLYGVALSPTDLVAMVFGSVIAGLATAGTTGIVQLGLIGTVVALVHVPFDAALVLFVSVDVVMNPFRTLVTVAPGLATATFVELRKHAPVLQAASAAP